MLGEELFKLGEAIHGSNKEKVILNILKERVSGNYPTYREYPVKTKEWIIDEFRFTVNGKEVKASLLPYTYGYLKGVVGKDIAFNVMPEHPFLVPSIHEENLKKKYSATVFYDNGKLRRIIVKGEKPAVFSSIPLKPGDVVEIESKSRLVDTISYNLEFTVEEGEKYIVIGAHVDHWLSGYHDNIFAVELLSTIEFPKFKHGLKIVFFSSEEGPKCCNGSVQQPKDGVFTMISLDALYPDRVVFSATPDLWDLSRFFYVKRVEMPTPYSDHFPYVMEGYPAMVLYNDDLIPYYHSDQDVPIDSDRAYAEELRKSLIRFLVELDKMRDEELNEKFFKYTESRGIKFLERKGSIIPYGLTSKLRGER